MAATAPHPALEHVRCLECGYRYSKPCRGGTAHENPGCPECTYVGWTPADPPLTAASLPLRSAWDLPQHPFVR
jgi:hypothetical protein